jgi:D-aspartate ligase
MRGLLMPARRGGDAITVDTKVAVLVLKMGRYVFHHGTLGIIRSLARLGVPVYAVVEDRFTPAALSRYLTGAFVWDNTDQDTRSLLKGLAAIGDRLGRPAILVPTDDLAAAFIASHAAALQAWFLFPKLPPELPRRLANKKELYLLCRTAGVPCPETAFPSSAGDVESFIERARFPIVVKAVESGGKQTSRTLLARTRQELAAICRRTGDLENPNLVFQEYIPRDNAEDWVFHGYFNPETDCFVAFTGRKMRSWPPFAGFTTLGVPLRNEALQQQTEMFVRAIGYAGIMDLDYRFDKRDGQYKLLDFNPRTGANFRMFEDADGVDVVRALHLDLTGRRVRSLPAVEGRTFIVEPFDLFASLGYMLQAGLTVRTWLLSLAGNREFGWFDRRDPLPSFVMCVRLLLHVLQRLAGKGLASLHISRVRQAIPGPVGGWPRTRGVE